MTTSKRKVSAIICAAGKGERAGFSTNKLLAPLYGAPAIWHTFTKFDIPEVDEVIVAAAKSDMNEIRTIAMPFGYKVVQGGKTRTESVKRALAEVSGDIVIIHDGARPFVSRGLILQCIDSVEKFSSGVCALPFTDTAVTAQLGLIATHIDRNSLYTVQTPQGYLTEDIRSAYELAGDKNYTDDSAVYCEFIARPRIIDGDRDNIKLTFKDDFLKEIPVANLPEGLRLRVGTGVDVHAFGGGNFVKLAGVGIPCDGGLVAHSDGDVVLHAVMDALLSAAGLYDIGHYFPDTDASFRNADSGELLGKVMELLRERNFEVVNLSVSIQAERPRLSPYIDAMKRNISGITGAAAENIAIAAGTCENLGFVGKGLGIAAYCTALIKKI